MIVKCKECDHDVSTEAAACPSCGCPQQPTASETALRTPKNRVSHMYGWVALIAFLMSNAIPAIIAPLVVLVGLVLSALEIKQGGKTFGGIVFVLCLLQAWFIVDHFGSLRSSLGITSPNKIEETTVQKSSATNLNVPAKGLAGPQKNAIRSAKQYLSIKGFSRDGLIRQLSSAAGNGYEVADATVAVDSLNVNWNEEAVKSAKQYLSIMGFSCDGLIQQLSSSAGDGYTESQASYGARQAGACN